MTTKESNRRQLNQCFIDLGERASVLGEKHIAIIAFVTGASILDESDDQLSVWANLFAELRIKQIGEELDKSNTD